MFWYEFRIHKTSKFGLFVNESSPSNFNLWSPGSYLVRSYLITTVNKKKNPKTMHFCALKYLEGTIGCVKFNSNPSIPT